MNIRLPVGMLSPYFITRADQSIAELADPAILVSREPVTLEILAGFLAFLNEDPPPRKPAFRLFGKPEPPPVLRPPLERARAMLRAITAESRWPRPEESICVNHPVVVMANTAPLDSLQALTVIKLRGFTMTLVLDISTCMPDIPNLVSVLAREKPERTPVFGSPGAAFSGYGAYRGLTTVAGLHATVLATGVPASQILVQ